MAEFYWGGIIDTDITNQGNWNDGASGYPGAGDDTIFDNSPSSPYYPFPNSPGSVDNTWASIKLAGFSMDIGTFEGAVTLQNSSGYGGQTLTASDRNGAITYDNSGDGSGGAGDGWDLAGTYASDCVVNCNGSGSSYLTTSGTFSGTVNLNSGGVDLINGSTWGGTFNIYACNFYNANFNIVNWVGGTIQNNGNTNSITELNAYSSIDFTSSSGTFDITDCYPMHADLTINHSNGAIRIQTSKIDFPGIANVKKGVVYDNGNLTGTYAPVVVGLLG